MSPTVKICIKLLHLSRHVDKAAWLFTPSPDTVLPDVQRHFLILSVSVSKRTVSRLPSLRLRVGVDTILEYVQVVGGRNGDDVL